MSIQHLVQRLPLPPSLEQVHCYSKPQLHSQGHPLLLKHSRYSLLYHIPAFICIENSRWGKNMAKPWQLKGLLCFQGLPLHHCSRIKIAIPPSTYFKNQMLCAAEEILQPCGFLEDVDSLEFGSKIFLGNTL